MTRVGLLALVVVAAVAGCSQDLLQPPPDVSVSSPEEIAAEFRQALAPFADLVKTAPSGATDEARVETTYSLTDEAKGSVMEGLRNTLAKHGASENGKKAIATTCIEIRDIIRQARDQRRWRLVLAAIEAYKILDPGPESETLRRERERAELRLQRPFVELKGFLSDNEKGDTYAFLQVTLPNNEVHMVQVRKGEEFLGLQFVDIIGKEQGVLLEFLKDPGDVFKVMGPWAR